MVLKSNVAIRTPRKQVWDFLTDPSQIGRCVPGVEKIEIVEPNKKYRGFVPVGRGGVEARFNGDVDVLELDELHRARLKTHGTATSTVADPLIEAFS